MKLEIEIDDGASPETVENVLDEVKGQIALGALNGVGDEFSWRYKNNMIPVVCPCGHEFAVKAYESPITCPACKVVFKKPWMNTYVPPERYRLYGGK